MAHVEKYARSAVGQLCQHYERKMKEDGTYMQFGNQDIDPTRTHLNYNLAPDRTLKGQIDFINQRCSEVKCLNRKDVNVMVSWVVTLPKEFPPERSREFFEKTYEFLNNRYGGDDGNEQNVISAYVHVDETTPHLHYAFVPVVTDKKSGKKKVSAKEAVNLTDLNSFHPNLEKYLFEHFGFEVGIINGATEEGNLSIKALKLQSKVEGLTEKISDLQAGVQHYEDMTVAVDEVGDVGKKSLIGKNIIVPPDEYALMQEQAKAYRANKGRIEQLDERELALEKTAQEQQAKLSEREQQLNSQARKNEKDRKEIEQLWDMAIKPGTFQIHYNQMEKELSVAVPKIKQLETKLADSVSRAVHDDVVANYNEQRSQSQSLHRKLLLSEQLIKSANDTNAELKKEIAEKDKKIDSLKDLCRGIYECFRNALQAVKLFKYGKDKYKVDGLSQEQGRLIDSLVDYGVKWAKDDGFPDVAAEIKADIGISEGIQECIDARTPQLQQKFTGRKM